LSEFTPPEQTEPQTLKKRNIFLRILFSIIWLIPLVLIVNVVIGAVIGGFAGSGVETTGNVQIDYEAGYQAGQSATNDFFSKYGGIVFFIQMSLWLALSILGILPGTGKYKKS
jgi:hypothetical protein